MSELKEDYRLIAKDFFPFKGQLEYSSRNNITPENSVWFKPMNILSRDLLLTGYNTAISAAGFVCFLKGLEFLANN
jgi:hypothetical protein